MKHSTAEDEVNLAATYTLLGGAGIGLGGLIAAWLLSTSFTSGIWYCVGFALGAFVGGNVVAIWLLWLTSWESRMSMKRRRNAEGSNG